MASFLKSLGRKLASGLRYNTVQIVSIKLGIISYIIGYAIIFKRGYQSSAPVTGNSALKVKGSSYNMGGLPWLPNATRAENSPPNLEQIYDSTDLVYPATERDAVFITTNLWITDNQTRGQCFPGSDEWFNNQFFGEAVAEEGCAETCVKGQVVNEADTRSGGVWTGNFTIKPDKKNNATYDLWNCYCELNTWCPDESIPNEIIDPFRLRGVANWTVSVKQAVSFRQFSTTTTNNSPKDNPIPPIYTVREILEGAGLTFAAVQAKGATIIMETAWDCNLDYSVNNCNPSVDFVSLGSGYNFRRVEFDRGIYSSRQLLKHYGIRLLVELSGQGSKFDAAALFTNIGAGIGLLAVASLVADFAAVNLLGHKALYEKAKYRHVEVKDGAIIRGKEETRAAEEALAAAAVAAAMRERKLAGLAPMSASEQAHTAAKAKANARANSAKDMAAAGVAVPTSPEPNSPLAANGAGTNGHGYGSAAPHDVEVGIASSPLRSRTPPVRGYTPQERAALAAKLAAAGLTPVPAADHEETGEGAGHQHVVRLHGHGDESPNAGGDEERGESNSRRTLAARMPRRSPGAASSASRTGSYDA